MAMESDDREMIFRVEPVSCKYMNEQMSDTGMVKQMMKVALQRPKKIITTNTTKMKANITVSASELILLVISREPSKIVEIWTSEGNEA